MQICRPRFKTIRIRDRGRLPHWEIDNGIYSVTFRLADSLPRETREQLLAERENLRREGIYNRNDVEKRFRAQVDEYLARGAGECHLTDSKVAQTVADALEFFDGRRYWLFAWCIMPNHAHVVVKIFPAWDFESPSFVEVLHCQTRKQHTRP